MAGQKYNPNKINYSLEDLNKVAKNYLGDNYNILDYKYTKGKLTCLVKCPDEKHEAYETYFAVIKKGCGCRKCYENPELLTTKKINKINKVCEQNNCKFVKIIPRGVKCVKSLMMTVQDAEGYLYDMTFDTLKYRDTQFRIKFNSNPHIFYNIKLWFLKNCPNYTLCDEFISSIYDKHKFKYVGAEYVTNPYFYTTFSSFLNTPIEHPEFKNKKSKGHRAVRNFFQELHIKIEEEKTFENLLSPKGYKLFFDFYLPDFNCVIEVDGKQHCAPVSKFGGEQTFSKLLEYDKIKNKYCKENHISILRIAYDRIVSNNHRTILSYFKKDIIEFLETHKEGN